MNASMRRELDKLVTGFTLSAKLRPTLKEIAHDEFLSEGVQEMMGRVSDFKNPTAAFFAGIAMVPEARVMWEGSLKDLWRADKLGLASSASMRPEIVVGGGLHAAIYSAVRREKGFVQPVVFDEGDAGGIFGVSNSPSFFLNSKNRPGGIGVPGDLSGSLNYIPGAILQPSDISSTEYQTNDVMAYIIRTTLAFSARVVTGTKVTKVGFPGGNKASVTTNKGFFQTRRVILATGLTKELDSEDVVIPKDPRVLRFKAFMAKMDEKFPLRGMKRVAVIGGGDSGKTVIEALTGQGPQAGWSVAALDYPDKIGWFGAPATSKADWQATQRGRYRGISRLLFDSVNPSCAPRVRCFPRASTIRTGYDAVYVNEDPYDYAIVCTGFSRYSLDTSGLASSVPVPQPDTTFPIARKFGATPIFAIGPTAGIEFQSLEPGRTIPENQVSIYRYGERTAQLAATLP